MQWGRGARRPEGQKDMLPKWLVPGAAGVSHYSLELTPLPAGCQTVSPLMIQSMLRLSTPREQHVQVQEGQVLVGMAQRQQELQKNPLAETPECPESPELDPGPEEEESGEGGQDRAVRVITLRLSSSRLSRNGRN